MLRKLNRLGPRAEIRLAALTLLLMVGSLGYSCSSPPDPISESPAPTMKNEEVVMPIDLSKDYSKFKHSEAQHERLPCLLCHVREEGMTRPKVPGHMPCAGCHVQQFKDEKNQICSICHTETGVKPFPALQSFNVNFDHVKHLNLTSCDTCHKPTRGGVARSIPSRAAAHQTCFQCHGPDTEVDGRNIGSCSTCHEPGGPAKNSEWAKAFKFNFNHQEHIRSGKMNCATCHTVFASGQRGRQVSATIASMHFPPSSSQSCSTCHNSKRAFGISDFTNCKRCHEGKSFEF